MEHGKLEPPMKKTEYLLVTAMMNLLKTHLFSHITVHAICDEAMVSRSTFYKYFEDKYALLRYYLNWSNKGLRNKLMGKTLSEYLFVMLEHIRSNTNIIRNVVSSGLSEEIMGIILNPHLVNIRNALLNHPEGMEEMPIEIAAYYHASAVVNTILLWVEKDLAYSVEEMALSLAALLPSSLRGSILPFEQ